MIEAMSPRSGGGVGRESERAIGAFIEFVFCDEGRAVVAEHGFGPP